MAMTGEQIATLITDDDCMPSLALLIRRARAGSPVRAISLAAVRSGLADLKAAIAVAELALGDGLPFAHCAK